MDRRSVRLLAFVAGLGPPALPLGCGVDGDPDAMLTDGDAPGCPAVDPELGWVAESSAPSTQAAEACFKWVDCECDERSHETVPSCRHEENMGFELDAAEAAAAGLVYDGACLALQVADLETLGCGFAGPDDLLSVVGPGRCGIFHGDRGPGESCTPVSGGVSDCAQGLACWGGRCVDPCAVTTSGERCAGPFNFACAPGEVCRSGRCSEPDPALEPSWVGEPCTNGCAPGLYCQITECGFEECLGECWILRPDGLGCEQDFMCDSGFCLDGTCARGPVTGEPCTTRCFGGRECVDGVCGPPEGDICGTLG
jgi:hypothetical protein